MSKCDKCKYPHDIRKWPCEDCLQGDRFEPKPTTNADRIRAMTDDELAEWLSDMHDSVTCPNGGAINCNPSCKRCWLDWLKEEVDDATND